MTKKPTSATNEALRTLACILASALVASCGEDGAAGPAGTPGVTGAAGATGATGPTGPAGASTADAAAPKPAPRLVWKDRLDATVHVVTRYAQGSNLDFEIADDKGYVWRSDGWGTVVPYVATSAPFLVYASADCSGTAYFSSVIPAGYVLAFETDSGAYRVIPGNVAGNAIAYNSTRILGQACQVSAGTALPGSVPYASMMPATPIVKPASLYAPPIRPVVE